METNEIVAAENIVEDVVENVAEEFSENLPEAIVENAGTGAKALVVMAAVGGTLVVEHFVIPAVKRAFGAIRKKIDAKKQSKETVVSAEDESEDTEE